MEAPSFRTGEDVTFTAPSNRVLLDEYEDSQRVHQQSAFLIDPNRAVRLAVTVDADTPEEISVGPLLDAIRDARSQ